MYGCKLQALLLFWTSYCNWFQAHQQLIQGASSSDPRRICKCFEAHHQVIRGASSIDSRRIIKWFEEHLQLIQGTSLIDSRRICNWFEAHLQLIWGASSIDSDSHDLRASFHFANILFVLPPLWIDLFDRMEWKRLFHPRENVLIPTRNLSFWLQKLARAKIEGFASLHGGQSARRAVGNSNIYGLTLLSRTVASCKPSFCFEPLTAYGG